MIKINSLLENNIFDEILIKKGKNRISDDIYTQLLNNKTFNHFVDNGMIKIERSECVTIDEQEPEYINIPEEKETPINFDRISYNELKAYVIKNNIPVKSMKKVDILAALKDETL